MVMIAYWCIEQNIYGPQMAKNIYGSPMANYVYGPKMAKSIYGFPWPNILMALQRPKILLAPITIHTYALFKMKRGDKQNLLKMQARQDNNNKSNA